MSLSNFDRELADYRAEQERDASVSAAQKAVAIKGRKTCIECDDEIEEARLRAAPFAQRCVDCQQAFEDANS